MPENYRGVQLLTEDPGTQTHWDGQRVFNVQERQQAGGASIAGPGPRFTSAPLHPEPDARSARAAQPPVDKRKPEKPKLSEKELMEMADKAIAQIRKQQESQMARGPAVNAEGTGYAQGQPAPAAAAHARPVRAPDPQAPAMRARASAGGTASSLEARRGMGGSKTETVPTSQAHFSADIKHPSTWVQETGQGIGESLAERVRKNPTFMRSPQVNLAAGAVRSLGNKMVAAQEHYLTHPEDVPLSRYNEPFRKHVEAPVQRLGDKLDDHASNNWTWYQNHKREILDRQIEEYQRKLDEAKKKAPVDGGEID